MRILNLNNNSIKINIVIVFLIRQITESYGFLCALHVNLGLFIVHYKAYWLVVW